MTDLYRIFDAEGALLYVGISLNAARRSSDHRAKPWWPQVARIEVETHPTRGDALHAEYAAIDDEKPRYNVRTTRPAARTDRQRAQDAARARRFRERQRGGPPRTLSDDPLARARRRLRQGWRVEDMDPAERDALRSYNAEKARQRRAR